MRAVRVSFVSLLLVALLAIIQLHLWPSLGEAQPLDGISKLIESARAQVGQTVFYDGTYRSIDYPGGDVSKDTGVCTDVIVRAYRNVGYDLQRLVHEDMRAHFPLYPSRRIWGLTRPDSNIDHRRVPNLQTFFTRFGEKRSTDLTVDAAQPGDLLVWMLPGNLPHIGIVSDRKRSDGREHLVIHNIGQGTKEEDLIGRYDLIGHFRYTPWKRE